ncbi:putative ribosomal protein L9/RNase H1 [Plasmopara halstedii]
MTSSDFYAVAAGRSTGIFTSWRECETQVKGFADCKFKKFKTQGEAQAFIDAHKCQNVKANSKRPREECAEVEKEFNSSAIKKQHRIDTSKRTQVKTLVPDKRQDCVGSWYAVAKGREAGDPDPEDPNSLVAFCDGSALNNGRESCRAGYACIFPHCEKWNVAKQLAMKRANLEDPERSRMLFIFSDSKLLIQSMTEWVDKWKKNNWFKSNGALVQNRDLLELLVTEEGSRRIRWTHVKAHTNKKDWKSKWNDVADNAARNAAMSICCD